ncbi:MAG: hypothetical protein WAM30_17530, partial [Candidatus Dormiibacterota bacterium]
NNEEAEVKRLLGIPAGFELAAHLGVGWPARLGFAGVRSSSSRPSTASTARRWRAATSAQHRAEHPAVSPGRQRSSR